MGEIVNRVANSGIITIDLGDFCPDVQLTGIDIAEQLWQGIVLREKEFRKWVGEHDWAQYKGQAVYILCSVDAIIPTWAYMLIGSKLIEEKVQFTIGSREQLERELIREAIAGADISGFNDSRIMIKGCSDIADPAFAMNELLIRLQPIAKSIMYGEPCSAVPVFKRK